MEQGQQVFASLMQRVREGSQDAAHELFQQYGPHILRIVRRKLHKTMRSKYDSSDFVQAVWASFFAIEPAQYHFEAP